MGRRELAETLDINEMLSRNLIFAYDNQHLFTIRQDTFETTKTALVLADLHIPYLHKINYEAVHQYIKNKHYDYIVLLGDVVDFYAISFFRKDPERAQHKNLKLEIEQCKAFLSELRDEFPNAKIIWMEGNHEERLRNHIWSKVPELDCVLDKLFVNLFELDKLKIDYIDKPFKLGMLWFLHGHERKGGNPEYIIKVFMDYVRDHFIIGHFHRIADGLFKSIGGTIHKGVSVGWLGDPETAADYAPLNKYCNGFAEIRFDKAGQYKIDNHAVINGDIF